MQGSINSSKIQKLVLPKSASTSQDSIEVQDNSSVVIVCANGSGKTRLGVWIELKSPQSFSVHRVAAQKSLSIPDLCSTSSMEIAGNKLLYGFDKDINDKNFLSYKEGSKWSRKPNTLLQNDYDKLLTYLFTEEFQKSTKYRQQAKITQQPENPPETRLDIIKRIWESVIPHREFIIAPGKIEARPKNGKTSYHSAEMSDGERVIFYLIGQCLAAKENSIIVIDEPELHLHKALQNRLWDAIEAERPDCLFVYLTHDLDFAVTRVNSTNIWVKSYENNQWDWSLISKEEDLPERLLLEILGSRKPILFIESKGGKESLDFLVYSRLYTDYTVIPRGGCSEVIHATRTFSNLKNLHNLECVGIIDRDYRTDEQIANLKKSGISCLNFLEIENIFLSENVLKVVANSLHRDDTANLIQKTKELVFKEIEREKERLISSIVAARVRQSLKEFNSKAIGEQELQKSLDYMLFKINLSSLYAEITNLIDNVLDTKDYPAALSLYDNQGLINRISPSFGFKNEGLREHIKRLIASKSNKDIVKALRCLLPELP